MRYFRQFAKPADSISLVPHAGSRPIAPVHVVAAMALLLVCARTAGAQCQPFINQGLRLSSFILVTPPDNRGSRIVAGASSVALTELLNSIPFPQTPDQLFCEHVEIAPGILAKVYVPTAGERMGHFSTYFGRLPEPESERVNGRLGETAGGGRWIPGNILPLARFGSYWFWRVAEIQFLPNSAGALTVTTNSTFPSASVGVPYLHFVTAAGGSPPYRWEFVSGGQSLINEMTLNAESGMITGIPMTTGRMSLPIRVTDHAGSIFTLTFSLIVNNQEGFSIR